MPDILIFGATGYTGRLTAHALARRGADFAIAGRNPAKLEELAAATGDPEIRIASVGDVDGLVQALAGAKTMITCVGPFAELGGTAVEAALRAGVTYVDSTGEGDFIEGLFGRDADARAAGIAMVPAMGFDDVPADVLSSLATQDMEQAELILTYAVSTTPSGGTARTLPSIVNAKVPWLRGGRKVRVGLGECTRWAPMPPPLGPRRAVSGPFAIARLAPRHLDLATLETYMAVSAGQYAGLKIGGPLLRAAFGFRPVRDTIGKVAGRIDGPGERGRARPWTILGEARSGHAWRNVTMTGTDVYGLTAELLASAALMATAPDFDATGVLTPVQAFGVQTLTKELEGFGVELDVKQPA